jgi:hypothetical protein
LYRHRDRHVQLSRRQAEDGGGSDVDDF